MASARSPLHTPLCDLLGIMQPVLLAPMANGPSTPELAAAVSAPAASASWPAPA